MRRGLSTIIGGVFMFIIMAGALNVMLWTVQQQDRITSAVTEKADTDQSRLNEEIEIKGIRIDGGRLNMTVANTGGQPARLASIYVVNETAYPKVQYRYDVDLPVNGGSTINNVGQAVPLVAKNTTSYSVKVATATGNSDSEQFLPLSLTPVPLGLYVIPPTVTTGENVTLLYTVTNNLTSTEPLKVYPSISRAVSCAGGECSATKMSSAPTSVSIPKGATSIIKEIYKVEGPVNTVVTFNATFAGAKQGNYAVEKSSVIVVSSSLSVSNTIATRPDMYLMLPGPFGDSVQQGLWGVVVANPTNSTMKVSRVIITSYTAAHSGSNEVVRSGCSRTAIFPSTSSEWSCPHDNQIQWKDVTTPEQIPPGEIRTFLARIQPGGLDFGQEEPGATTTATVYTDIGIFTKAGYTVGMTSNAANQPLGNVYLTDTTDTSTSGALNNAHMFGHKVSIPPGSTQTFYVSMADLDTDVNTYINAGGKLIINVPPEFSEVTVTSATNFSPVTVTKRADGITQIIAVTTGETGNDASGEAKVIRFTAKTPSPAAGTTYIMFTYIDGVTNTPTPFSAGAIAEIALQVNGT
jgi:hypothetical protein